MRAKFVLSFITIAALATLAACSPKPATEESSSAMAESPASMPDTSSMSDMSGMAMDTMAKTGRSVGEITAIDKAAGTVTIKHDAIPEISWPAMTMAFKANPASVLDGLKIGEKVSFDVTVKGSDAEVTAVSAK